MANKGQGSRADEPSEPHRDKISIGTPEDVAALFAWANLQGARYWDFSESRRRYRRQVRSLAAASIAEHRAQEHVASVQFTDANGSGISQGSDPKPEPKRQKLKEETAGGAFFLRSQQYKVAEAFVESSRDTGKYQPVLLWEPAPVRAPQPGLPEDPGEVWRHSLMDGYPPAHVPEQAMPALHQTSAWPDSGIGGKETGLTPAWMYSDLSGSGYGSATEPIAEKRRADGHRRTRILPSFECSPQEPGGAQSGASLAIIFSLSGGVGRTSLLANVGRALSRSGERVALLDAAPQSPLPFYFGARERRPGVARAFASPIYPSDPAVFVASYDLRAATRPDDQRQLMGEILRNGLQTCRILLDLPISAEWLLRRLAALEPALLVPIVPDVNAVLRIDAAERYFEALNGSRSDPLVPLYLLTQIDSSVPLHNDVREILEHQLGPRLLAPSVRRSPLVSEALAHGLTVIDYAGASAVAQDYIEVADWVKNLAPDALVHPAAKGSR